MKIDILDKIIILALIAILPASIFLASKFQNENETLMVKKIQDEQLAKVNKVIENIEETKNSQEIGSKIIPIKISNVEYATDSGKLTIEGLAPGKNLNIMVSAVLTSKDDKKNINNKIASKAAILDEDLVLGQNVEVIAIKTDENGNFKFVKNINIKTTDAIELRFDQAESSATIQYDFSENKRNF